MKVLNVIPRYLPAIGGSEIWCSQLCRFLAKSGLVTEVATMNLYNVAEAFDKNFEAEEYIKLGDEDCIDGVFIKRYKLWKPWLDLPSAKILRFLLNKLGLKKLEFFDVFITSPNSLEMYNKLSKRIKSADLIILHTLPYFHTLVGFF